MARTALWSSARVAVICVSVVSACSSQSTPDEGDWNWSVALTGSHRIQQVAPVLQADAVAVAISESMEPVADVPAGTLAVEHRLRSFPAAQLFDEVNWASCNGLLGNLSNACVALMEAGEVETCWPESSYFAAHQTPRCAVRVQVGTESDPMPDVYALDFSGEPMSLPPDRCGDGNVDEEEQCDDGNRDPWDGCDPNCMNEEFNGCEAIIEDYYQRAELAFVDRELWDGPRSHLMVNQTASALRAVDQTSCTAAIALGTDVCRELEHTMPYVSWCQPAGELRDGPDGPECAIRLRVGFQTVAPEAGVFTTRLNGILAFTIR